MVRLAAKSAKRKQKQEKNGSHDGEKKQKTNNAQPEGDDEGEHDAESTPPDASAFRNGEDADVPMGTANGHEDEESVKEGFKYVESFRKKLQSGAVAMDAIRHFIQQSSKDPNIIVYFIRAGGTFKPLLDILGSCEKDKLSDIADMLHIIHLVMIKSLGYDETHANYAAKCAKTIMSDHRPTIVSVLRDRGEQAQACRASVFRILKALLLVNPGEYGRDILNLMDVYMPELEMHKCRETIVEQGGSLRTAFIECNLAFLIDTSPELVRLWLTRAHLIQPLVSNLVYDLAENVVLVMRGLRQYVLANDTIDKYICRTVFTNDVLKGLVNVYEWVGPEKQTTSEEQKAAVLNASEEVLLPLLTSKRFFLVPKSIDLNRASPRHKHLLLGLKNSQLHAHQQRLVLRLFETCPEVLPAVLENYGGLLKTKRDSHRKLLMDILKLHKPQEVVAGLDAAVVSPKALSNFVIKSTLPRTVLEYVGVAMGAKQENIPFGLEMLSLMVGRCEQYLLAIEQARTVDQFGLKKLKFDAINQILALFPSVDRIVEAMKQHRDDRRALHSNVAMEHAMDILLVCIRSFPAYVESSAFITTYQDILRPAFRTPGQEQYYLGYEFKAIKVVIALEPQSVSFGSPLFASVLNTVSKMYLNAQPALRREATEMLLALFRNTALFGNHGTQIEFWFQALYDIKPSLVPELVLYLANAARNAAKNASKQPRTGADHSLIDDAFVGRAGERNSDDVEELFARIEQEADEEEGVAEGSAQVTRADEPVELPVTDNFFIYMFAKGMTHPPKYGRYFTGVMLRYLHFLPHPEIVEKALKLSVGKGDANGSSAVAKYVRSWMSGNDCALPPDDGWGILSALSKALVEQDKTVALFPKKVTEWRSFRSEVIHMLHQTMFHLSRLIAAGTLTAAHAEVISHYTNQLLDLLLSEQTLVSEADMGEVMAGLFLQRPVVFERFTIVMVAQEADGGQAGTVRQLVAAFMCELMQKLHHLPNFDRYTAPYSNKIVSELMRTSTKASAAVAVDSGLVEQLLRIFKLSERHCATLLRHYAQLPVDAFLEPAKGNRRTCHYDQLCLALERLAAGSGEGRTVGEHFLPERTVRGLVRIYSQCGQSAGSDPIALEEFERALLGYLSTFTHSVAHVEPELMRVFFENRQRAGKPLVKLATFLLGRDARFDAPFLELVGQHTTRKELVYPLLDVAFRRSVLSATTEADKRLLAKLYGEFKGGIQKMLEKPHKAAVIYRENPLANESLVRLCMPRNECVDFARKKLRIEAVEVFQLRVLMEIYRSALEALAEDGAQQAVVYANVFSVLLQCFEVLFRPLASAESVLLSDEVVARLNELVLALYGWSRHVKRFKALREMPFGGITSSANWNSFCKTCLKFGIDMPRCADNPHRYDERLHVLPKTMAVLVDLFYANDGPEGQADIGRYFDWALSHSLFLRVLLTQFHFKPKTALVHLLYVLVRKCNTVADGKHVPLLLGAYGATITDCNRYILALLQLYEQAGVEMHEFRPFLWGETAIKHFSLTADATDGGEGAPAPVHRRQRFRTDPAEVFSLLAREKLTATAQNFPVWRQLDACAQLPEVQFDDVSAQADTDEGLQWGYQPTGVLEQFVEKPRWGRKFEKAPPAQLLQLRAVKVELRGMIYDPAFLVPLMGYLFSPENAEMLVPAGRAGALALPFLCLASSDEQMRLAAGGVILGIREQLDCSKKFIDWQFWLHLFSVVQNGFAAMKAQTDKRQQAPALPRAPFLSTLFVAETINVLPNVLSDLHGPLTSYIMRQEMYNFRAIPNFLTLFHSADVKHAVHRLFMLETICRGIQTHADFGLLRASPIVRVMMHFYGSSLSNRELNVTILNALNAMAKIPLSCEALVNHFGFVPWLSQRVDAIESFHFDTIEAFLGLLSNCWYSLQVAAIASSAASHSASAPRRQQQYAHLPLPMQRAILIATLKFFPLLSTRSSSKTLVRFLNLLEKTTSPRFSNERLLALVSEPLLQQMLEYFEKLFGAHLWCVRYVRQCGTHAADDDATMGRKLSAGGADRTTVLIVLSLRRFVIRWHNFQKEAAAIAGSAILAAEEEVVELKDERGDLEMEED